MSKRSPFVVAALFTLALAAHAQPNSARHFDGKSWWAHVKFLADDKLEGRETGSAGLRKAESYIVDQFTKAGLRPRGVNGFYQPVKLVSRRIVEKASSVALVRNGKIEPLLLGEDTYFNTRVDLTREEIIAPVVFAGYGLRIPEKGYDDLAGLDLRGKIVAYLAGSPAEIPTALSAHYQNTGERWKSLKQAGVIGTINIPNPASMDIPWARMSLNRAHPSMELAGPAFDETPGAKLALTFNPAKAEKLFAGSSHSFLEISALGKARQVLPHFPLGLSWKARATVNTAPVESANVIAELPGSDPTLVDEYVVLSAHADHVGIGEPINGDRIYNGAMDNAAGVALLVDLAANLKTHPERLRRSLLFVVVTAEEKGLLGSKYFAAHPTVPAKSMIADINFDMFLPIVPLKVLRVLGLEESDLGDRVREAAQGFGVRVQPDPEPLRNTFIRSDQYNFIRHGIPALKYDFSFEPGSPEQKIFKDWLTNRYHAPSDDSNQPVDLEAVALYEEISRQLLISVANSDTRPKWAPDSFFRRYVSAD